MMLQTSHQHYFHYSTPCYAILLTNIYIFMMLLTSHRRFYHYGTPNTLHFNLHQVLLGNIPSQNTFNIYKYLHLNDDFEQQLALHYVHYGSVTIPSSGSSGLYPPRIPSILFTNIKNSYIVMMLLNSNQHCFILQIFAPWHGMAQHHIFIGFSWNTLQFSICNTCMHKQIHCSDASDVQSIYVLNPK